MVVRTNVAGSLDALELNQAVLLRRLVAVEVLLSQVDEAAFGALAEVEVLRVEVERLSVSLDEALFELDALGADDVAS